MKKDFSGDKESYTTFLDLDGRLVTLDEVRRHLATLPLDLVLGVLARISAHQVRDGQEFFGHQAQGPYLNFAIADDFPAPMRNAVKMYAAGRVPITGGRHVFIHEHTLAALAQLAVVHCDTAQTTSRISLADYGRIGGQVPICV